MRFTIQMAISAVLIYGSIAVWDSGQGCAQPPSADSDANVDLAIAPRYEEPRPDLGNGEFLIEADPRPARVDPFGRHDFRAQSITPLALAASQADGAGYWANTPAGLTIFADGQFSVVGQDEWGKAENKEKLLRQSKAVQSELQKAMNQLRAESTSESERAQAKKTISQYLEVQFDADHERRVQQLQSLEKKVESLKAQLQKRAESKNRMIELRMTLIENEAEGLGFPAAWSVQTGNLSTTNQGMRVFGQQNMENGRFPYAVAPTSAAPSSFDGGGFGSDLGLRTQTTAPTPAYSNPGAR